MVQPNLVLVTAEMGILRHTTHQARHQPDQEQQAWYVSKYETLGRDDMHSEFPSMMEETF